MNEQITAWAIKKEGYAIRTSKWIMLFTNEKDAHIAAVQSHKKNEWYTVDKVSFDIFATLEGYCSFRWLKIESAKKTIADTVQQQRYSQDTKDKLLKYLDDGKTIDATLWEIVYYTYLSRWRESARILELFTSNDLAEIVRHLSDPGHMKVSSMSFHTYSNLPEYQSSNSNDPNIVVTREHLEHQREILQKRRDTQEEELEKVKGRKDTVNKKNRIKKIQKEIEGIAQSIISHEQMLAHSYFDQNTA